MENKYTVEKQVNKGGFLDNFVNVSTYNRRELLDIFAKEASLDTYYLISFHDTMGDGMKGHIKIKTEMELKVVPTKRIEILKQPHYSKVKGFFKKLKLIFSKKEIYVEE